MLSGRAGKMAKFFAPLCTAETSLAQPVGIIGAQAAYIQEEYQGHIVFVPPTDYRLWARFMLKRQIH